MESLRTKGVSERDELCIQTIRFLALDAVEAPRAAIRVCRWAWPRRHIRCGRGTLGSTPPTPG